MASSPKWKVYDNNNTYQASFKDVYDAVRFISICEDGWNIREGHGKPAYTQGVDGNAWDSYDDAVGIILERVRFIEDEETK